MRADGYSPKGLNGFVPVENGTPFVSTYSQAGATAINTENSG